MQDLSRNVSVLSKYSQWDSNNANFHFQWQQPKFWSDWDNDNKIRPVAGQESSSAIALFLSEAFRILYQFVPNMIQINQRLCKNWHCKDLTQKYSKSVTLTLRPCTGMGMVLRKILDKDLSSCHKWIKSIKGFAKKLKLYKMYHKTFI